MERFYVLLGVLQRVGGVRAGEAFFFSTVKNNLFRCFVVC